ncbi:hypothetical protein SNE40_013119 [Patella caerulea]|uniref:Uncharacterized protein n=1 Tax=Patella caerulea TaxID=87958 RepID=A0AAN8PWK0_PATCE
MELLDDSTKFLENLDGATCIADDFPLPRYSKDSKTNNFGLKLLTLCATLNVHIVNGRLDSDRIGELTCIKHNGASVVDYLIVSNCIFNLITNLYVQQRTESDHLPLEFTIVCNIR